jgi:DNA-binding GntR family transcriptional regulator
MARNVARPQAAHSRSPRELIVRDIIRGLYEGRYLPGQRLVEADLTAHYRVSRGPVREALNWLAAHGIVSLTLQRGAQVRCLSREEAIDILVVVESLIGLAACLAALRVGSSEAAGKLRDALTRLEEFDPSSGSSDYAHARDSFYGVLMEIAGNAELCRIMPGTLVHLVRVQYRDALRAANPTRHADYRGIAKAVLAGDGEEAESAARAHIAKMIAVLAHYPGEAWGRTLPGLRVAIGRSRQSLYERRSRRKQRTG